MNLKDWIGVLAALIMCMGSAGAAGVWMFDQRYVTQQDITVKDIRDLNREIRKIDTKKSYGQAQQYEIDHMNQLIDEVKALELQLQVQ